MKVFLQHSQSPGPNLKTYSLTSKRLSLWSSFYHVRVCVLCVSPAQAQGFRCLSLTTPRRSGEDSAVKSDSSLVAIGESRTVSVETQTDSPVTTLIKNKKVTCVTNKCK